MKVLHDAELANVKAESLAAARENETVAAQAAKDHAAALGAAAANAAAQEDAHRAALAEVRESALAGSALDATAHASGDDAEQRSLDAGAAAHVLSDVVWQGDVQWQTAMKTTRGKFVWVDSAGDVYACVGGIDGARADATPAIPFGAAAFERDPDSDTKGTFRWQSAHEDSLHKSDSVVFASAEARTAFAAALVEAAVQTGTLGRRGTLMIDGANDDVAARADMYEGIARDAAAAQRAADESARLAAAEGQRRAEEAEAEEKKRALAHSRAQLLLPPAASDMACLNALRETLKYSDVGELLDEMARRSSAAERDAGVISRENFVAVVGALDEGTPETLRAAPLLFDAIAACAGHHTAPPALAVPEVVAAFSVASITKVRTLFISFVCFLVLLFAHLFLFFLAAPRRSRSRRPSRSTCLRRTTAMVMGR